MHLNFSITIDLTSSKDLYCERHLIIEEL